MNSNIENSYTSNNIIFMDKSSNFFYAYVYDEEIINWINLIRKNPDIYSEKILNYKKYLTEKKIKDKKLYIYNHKFIVPGGEDLFDQISKFFKKAEKLNELKGKNELLINREFEIKENQNHNQSLNPNQNLNNNQTQKKDFSLVFLKNEYKKLKENFKNYFKNFYISTYMGNSSFEDGIFMLIISSFLFKKSLNKKMQSRAIDIIMNKDIKYIGVNLEKKENDLKGFLIFAD
jgi:hypothetical protein